MLHSNVKSVPLIWFFLYCRREYIRLGSKQDPTWRDFSQALAETGGARHYVTLFEAPFQASVLKDSENNALWASSLMAIPPLPPGSQPLAGSTAVDLMGNNLTQWASDVQEVTSYMRWPPEAAVRCPELIGGTCQGAILPELLWCRPGVSVLHSPSPGLWPNGSLVGTTHIELLGYGLLH